MKWNQSIDPERINLKYQVLCIERLSEYRADWQGVTAEKIPLSPFKKGGFRIRVKRKIVMTTTIDR
jgi:hypothetical protein